MSSRCSLTRRKTTTGWRNSKWTWRSLAPWESRSFGYGESAVWFESKRTWMVGFPKLDFPPGGTSWRPEAEMKDHMGWLIQGQILASTMFVILWAKGFAATNCLRCACIFGMSWVFSKRRTLSSPALCNRFRAAWPWNGLSSSARNIVRRIAANTAAGTPLPITSATTSKTMCPEIFSTS